MAGPVARVQAVCIGQARRAPHSSGGRTAIDKRRVEGPVMAELAGLVGDEQADRKHHGGADQALYAYAQEDADHWSRELQRDLPAGSFGENLRVVGLPVSGAAIGEIWRLGASTVQVTAPRIPCRTFAAFWDVPDLISRFLAAGRPGAYLRVLAPGPVQAGDRIEVLERPATDLTVADVAAIVTRAQHEAGRLLALPGLAARLCDWARDRAPEPSAS